MNKNINLPEVWMRGPVPRVSALLQPVAHALMQVKEEAETLMAGFPDKILWEQFAGMASPAFHLQHMVGVLDRLFTYADNKQLTDEQLQYLANEGKFDGELTSDQLVKIFKMAIEQAIEKLKTIDPDTLTNYRGVGRKQLPSTVIGLLVHAAEHTTRHFGQLLVTVNFLKANL